VPFRASFRRKVDSRPSIRLPQRRETDGRRWAGVSKRDRGHIVKADRAAKDFRQKESIAEEENVPHPGEAFSSAHGCFSPSNFPTGRGERVTNEHVQSAARTRGRLFSFATGLRASGCELRLKSHIGQRVRSRFMIMSSLVST
jgi:hypothetical protein